MSSCAPAVSLRPITIIDPRARPLCFAIGGIWLTLAIAGPLLHFKIDPELFSLGIPLVFFMTTALILKRLDLFAMAAAVECMTLLVTTAVSSVLLSFLLARLNLPYIDPALNAVERSIGFDWPSMAVAFSHTRWLPTAANFVYQSLWWQITALVLLHCAVDNKEHCWTFALAWALSLIAALAIFAVAPAIGAYAFHHLGPDVIGGPASEISGRSAATLEYLRKASSIIVRSQDFDGVVEFPSFHTASAVLLCWGFWPMKRARYPALALNLGVILAAVPIGGHYLADIPGGVAVAILGINGAVRWHRSWRDAGGGLVSRRVPARERLNVLWKFPA